MTEASTRDTPAAEAPLGSDKSGDPFNEDWSYPVAVRMLLHLSLNSRPDIQHAVHSAARFSHNPLKSHGQAVKRIARHLLKTLTEGNLVPSPVGSRVGLFCRCRLRRPTRMRGRPRPFICQISNWFCINTLRMSCALAKQNADLHHS